MKTAHLPNTKCFSIRISFAIVKKQNSRVLVSNLEFELPRCSLKASPISTILFETPPWHPRQREVHITKHRGRVITLLQEHHHLNLNKMELPWTEQELTSSGCPYIICISTLFFVKSYVPPPPLKFVKSFLTLSIEAKNFYYNLHDINFPLPPPMHHLVNVPHAQTIITKSLLSSLISIASTIFLIYKTTLKLFLQIYLNICIS